MREENSKPIADEPAAAEKQAEQPAAPSGPMNYVEHIRAMMKSDKRRGNVKDFVILAHHATIYDNDRYYEVRARLPDQLEPKSHVYVYDRDGELVPASVVRVDEEGAIWLTFGNGEFKVTRAECYPTAIPRTPKLVHKSRLARYIGDRYSSMFWNKTLNKRVVRPGKVS